MAKKIKTVTIEKTYKNIMGTLSIVMKIQGMRKFQDFSVYPIAKGGNTELITIQSNTRYGKISIKDGKLLVSKSRSNGACSPHFEMDRMNNKLDLAQITPTDLDMLKERLFETKGEKVGNSVVKSDNSGISILSL